MNSILPPWRSSVARALHRNRSLPNARYVQLATIDRDHRPKNRTVVFRGWLEPQSQLKFVVDIRSQKALNLLSGSSSWAEICWYFPKTREQFRVSGELVLVTAKSATGRVTRPVVLGFPQAEHLFKTAECLIDGYCKARQEAWQQMSDSGRVQFDWATPGADRSTDPASFNPPQPDEREPLDNFCLLLLKPTAVDHLELRGEPQSRYRYELVEDNWIMSVINP